MFHCGSFGTGTALLDAGAAVEGPEVGCCLAGDCAIAGGDGCCFAGATADGAVGGCRGRTCAIADGGAAEDDVIGALDVMTGGALLAVFRPPCESTSPFMEPRSGGVPRTCGRRRRRS